MLAIWRRCCAYGRSGSPYQLVAQRHVFLVPVAGRRSPVAGLGSGLAGHPYDEAVMDQLRFIRAAQAVGLTLGEVKGVIDFREQGSAPCAHVLEIIEARFGLSRPEDR